MVDVSHVLLAQEVAIYCDRILHRVFNEELALLDESVLDRFGPDHDSRFASELLD